jgi:hypothetical protein
LLTHSLSRVVCAATVVLAMRSRLRRGIHPHVLPHTNLCDILQPPDAAAASAGCVLSKVVGTLGPACVETTTLAAMLRAGLSCARVDLTWGGLSFHMRALANLNEVRAVLRVFACALSSCARKPDHSNAGWPQALARSRKATVSMCCTRSRWLSWPRDDQLCGTNAYTLLRPCAPAPRSAPS